MRMSRAVLLAVVAWLAVVAVGSTAVWFVISSAGENVGTAEDARTQAAATAPGAATPRVHRTRPPGNLPHSAISTPPSTTQPSSGRPSTSPSYSVPPSTGAPSARRRIWEGIGGLVTAQCRGRDIEFAALQPDNGFAVEVGDNGPVTLEVHFTGQEDQSGRQSEVTARCVAGVPNFASQSESGGGGDE